jgi:hypothetical protein
MIRQPLSDKELDSLIRVALRQRVAGARHLTYRARLARLLKAAYSLRHRRESMRGVEFLARSLKTKALSFAFSNRQKYNVPRHSRCGYPDYSWGNCYLHTWLIYGSFQTQRFLTL